MNDDNKFMNQAIEYALRSEREGNPPVGAVITLRGEVVGGGGAMNFLPKFDGTRHAEMEALRSVPANLWKSSHKMSLYTTLEPCLMCFGSIIIHGIGRIVFGANDPSGGASSILPFLPTYYQKRIKNTEWLGPIMPSECDLLFERLMIYLEKASADTNIK